MKELRVSNANNSCNVRYLVDLIGNSQSFTIHEVKDQSDLEVSMGFNFVHNFYNLGQIKQFCIDNNFQLEIHETGQDKITYGTIVPLAITSEDGDIVDASVDVASSFNILAEGGNAPYVYTEDAGSTLPAGLTLASDGLVAGTPTETGTFALIAIVTDVFGITDTVTFNFTIS